ncbi:hypothetical protein PFISCL1PPCAC_16690, partial [Pristionchus fissidentatus]
PETLTFVFFPGDERCLKSVIKIERNEKQSGDTKPILEISIYLIRLIPPLRMNNQVKSHKKGNPN